MNAVQINAVSTSSVNAVNANQGTTQPLNFTGTSLNALVKTDVIDWASTVVPSPNVTGVPITDPGYLKGTALTDTAGRLAAGFSTFFNIASPTSTIDM